MNEHTEQGQGPRLPRLRAAANENAQVTQQNRHLALASEQGGELAEGGAIF